MFSADGALKTTTIPINADNNAKDGKASYRRNPEVGIKRREHRRGGRGGKGRERNRRSTQRRAKNITNNKACFLPKRGELKNEIKERQQTNKK